MESGEDSPGFIITGLANRVTNVDGRILNKDGLPMLPRRNILFNSANLGGPKIEVTSAELEVGNKVEPVVGRSEGNGDSNVGSSAAPIPIRSYADAVSPDMTEPPSESGGPGLPIRKVNFRLIEPVLPSPEGVDVHIPLSSVLEANSRFEFTLYGYFLGKRVAFPVVQNYVSNVWKKYGITNAMMNAKGFFFFKFKSAAGMEGVLENGPWFIRSSPIILKKWTSESTLLKEDIRSVPIWVKLHDVPVAAFTEDGLSAIASKLGTPLMLDSYTSNMCMSSWGRLDFARALIDIRADRDLKKALTVSIPSAADHSVTLHSVKVEYEWKPPRCNSCQVFGHETSHCPNLKVSAPIQTGPKKGPEQPKDSQGFQQVKRKPFKPFKGLMVGNQNKVVVGSKKQVYVPKPKENKEARKTSTSNSFEALNKVDPNVEPSASTSKVLDPLVEDSQEKERGKAKAQESTNLKGGSMPSLYQQWKDAKRDQPWNEVDSDEDEVMDPFDYDMSEFMDLHERQGRKNR